MRERNGSIVRRNGIEVAFDDARKSGAIRALIRRHDPLRRRVLSEVVGIVEVGRRSSRLPRAIESRIVGTRNVPFRLGELPVLDAHANGHDGRAAALLHCSVYPAWPLTGSRYLRCTLRARHSLPHAIAGPYVDRVLRLPETDHERRGARIVLDHGGEIPIEHHAETGPIARVLRPRLCHGSRRHHDTADDPSVSRHHAPPDSWRSSDRVVTTDCCAHSYCNAGRSVFRSARELQASFFTWVDDDVYTES